MAPVQSSSVILVVVDGNFSKQCNEPDAYVTRLKKILGERTTDTITIMTVSGNYGLGGVDSGIKAVAVDDKNKTLFGQTLENISSIFDELLAITNTLHDPYINAAKDVMGNAGKTITTFGYQRKS